MEAVTDAQCLGDPARGARPRAQLGHRPQILLLQGRQSIETDPKEVVVEVGYHVRAGDSDHVTGNRACGGRVPDLKPPFLDEVREVPSGGKDFFHRVPVERHAFGFRGLHESRSGVIGLQRTDLGIVEQPLRVGFCFAGQRRDLGKPRGD